MCVFDANVECVKSFRKCNRIMDLKDRISKLDANLPLANTVSNKE